MGAVAAHALDLVCTYILIVYRGHTVRAVMESFQMAKDAGFKVVTHMMPDLPNVGLERDIDQFVVSLHRQHLSVVNLAA